MRYFRCLAGDATYEAVRLTLDAAWGLPNDKGTPTCMEPANIAPRDLQNRIVVAVNDEFCQYPAVIEMLPGLLQSGAVEEITREVYTEAWPTTI
jgi:hypothetical protein